MCKDPGVKVHEVFIQRPKLRAVRPGTQREVAGDAQAMEDLEYHVLVKSLNVSLWRKGATESLGIGKLHNGMRVLGR